MFLVAILVAIMPVWSLFSSGSGTGPVTPSLTILIVLFFLTILLMFKVAFSDPGIIPRRCVIERLLGSTRAESNREVRSIVEAFKDVPGSIYCHTCDIWRPPSASHCSDCGNCVMGFDHHCAVLNNCIGQRNYPYFVLLMPSVCCLAISFLFQIKFPEEGGEKPTSSEPSIVYIFVTRLLVMVASLALALVVALLGYHLWLLLWAKTTTKNHLRGVQTGRISIMDRIKGADALFDLRDRVSRHHRDSYAEP